MGFFRKTWFIWEKPILSARADNLGFSQINCLYLRAQIIWVFPTSSACLLSFCLYQNMKMRLEKPILFACTDKGSFSQINNVGFFRKTYFIWEKPILSDQIMWVFQENPHYLQIMWVFSEKTHFIWEKPILPDQIMWAF